MNDDQNTPKSTTPRKTGFHSISELASLPFMQGCQVHVAETAKVDASNCVVDSISLDSQEVAETGIFAALPGTRTHGANYAADCQAAAILTDGEGVRILRDGGEARPIIEVSDIRSVLGLLSAHIYGNPTASMTVIGVTGTSGKTTTSYLLEEGLIAAGKSVGLIGTTGTRINRKPVATKLTTPEAPKLQELFAIMQKQGVSHVVMEVSSHALSLGRVQGTHFAAGGFSNLSQDHLDFHPTMHEYFDAKAALFSGPLAAQKAVICVDDSWGVQMANVAAGAGSLHAVVSTKACPSITTETVKQPSAALSDAPVLPDAPVQITASAVAANASGAQEVKLSALEPARSTEAISQIFTLPLPGEFNVANAALATGLALAVGIDISAFLNGIEQVQVPGRMERIDLGQDFIAVVDYAHKPAAVTAVLETLRGQLDAGVGREGRIGVVVGAGGDRDSAKRPIMGANAAAVAQLVIVTDDNPRTEDPASIRAAVLQGAKSQASNAEIREVASRAQAIDELVAWAEPGDAIIIVGKGHEVGQIYGANTLHFDDREELRRALKARLEKDTQVEGTKA